jgi:hypothetical protein
MSCPADHEKYHTQAEAEAALRRLVAQAKHTGLGGRSWKRLNVFPCGNHFHIGRANQLSAKHRKSAPAPKPASFGDLRRKLERMERQWERKEDYERRQRADAIGKLIAAEQAIEDAERGYAELQRQALKLFFPEML